MSLAEKHRTTFPECCRYLSELIPEPSRHAGELRKIQVIYFEYFDHQYNHINRPAAKHFVQRAFVEPLDVLFLARWCDADVLRVE